MLSQSNEETSLTNLHFSPNASNEVEPIASLFNEVVLDIPVLVSGDHYMESNNIASAIVQLYKPIESRKESIRQYLCGFKEALELSKESTIFECFKALRDNVSSNVHLELIFAGTEAIKLKINTIDDTGAVSDKVKKATVLFNSCLTQCQKFEGEKELRVADIQFRIEELQLMPLTKEGQMLYQSISKIPTYIDQLSSDIASLQNDIYKASNLLRPQ